MKQSKWGLAVAVLALVALVAVFAAASPAETAQQRQRFDWVIARQLTVLEGGIEMFSDLELAGDLAVDHDVAAGGDVAVTGAVTAGTVTAADLTATDDMAANSGAFTTSVTAADLVATDDLTVGDDLDVNGDLTAGSGTFTNTVTAEQLTTTDDLRVEDDTLMFGDVDIAGALTAGDTTAVGDLTVWPEQTGGNAGAKNELIGLPRITFVELLTGTNGTTETAAYIDTTPTGEWAEVDAGGNITVTADTTIYRHTTNSLKIEFTSVVTPDGVDGTIAEDDMSGNESLGFWIYSTEALTSGDFAVTLDDTDGTDQSYNVPAVSADIWTWVELNIAACDANCDSVDGIHFLATEQGAGNLTAVDIYLDGMMKWDADDEEALGLAIVQDGVLNILTIPTAAATDNTWGVAVENVDFFINYADGADGLVWITDQSAVQALAFVAY